MEGDEHVPPSLELVSLPHSLIYDNDNDDADKSFPLCPLDKPRIGMTFQYMYKINGTHQLLLLLPLTERELVCFIVVDSCIQVCICYFYFTMYLGIQLFKFCSFIFFKEFFLLSHVVMSSCRILSYVRRTYM